MRYTYKKVIFAFLIDVLPIPVAFAENITMTDGDIVLLFDSTRGENTALRSLLPKDEFTLKTVLVDRYQIEVKDAPEG